MKPADGTGQQARARGPRSDGGRAREQILDAARRRFGAHGFAGATLRAIAADAGVDVALVSYYFGSKRDLFLAALRLPLNPGDVVAGLLDGPADDLGARIVRRLLAVWDEPATGGPLVSVLRSSASQGDLLRDFIERELVARLAAAIDAPDAGLRAAAATTQILGLVFERYVLGVEPVASAAHEDLVALVGPTLQRYLVG